LSTELFAGSDLDNVSKSDGSDYYGQDFNEILNTAKAKEFGISYIEALDSIEDLFGVVKQMENF
jgi:hypothetical protein